MLPGSIATVGKSDCKLVHRHTAEQIDHLFGNKREYLRDYARRQQPYSQPNARPVPGPCHGNNSSWR